MEPVVADLHVHTTRSDGAIDPDDLGRLAADRGLEVVAMTDHDQLPPTDVGGEGATVVGGIELRVEAADVGRVDLLGYGVRRTASLEATIEHLQADRIERARAIRERLEDRLGVTLEVDLEAGVGRPHLARAVAAATDLGYQAVFDRYIGRDGPCYVPRDVPSFERGRRLLREACDLVVLAHPMRYRDPARALALVSGLDGLEFAYPYEDARALDRLAGLIAGDPLRTGGSDAHRLDDLGRAGLDRDALAPIARRLGLVGW
ncbi:MAG: PHP domain-containing protein [Halobacteriales archaeon]